MPVTKAHHSVKPGDVLTFVQFWYDNREKRGQIPPGWSSRYRRPVYA